MAESLQTALGTVITYSEINAIVPTAIRRFFCGYQKKKDFRNCFVLSGIFFFSVIFNELVSSHVLVSVVVFVSSMCQFTAGIFLDIC